jgi:hypothetical protein
MNSRPLSCIHYSIKRRIALNDRVVTNNTEQDLALAPSFYWELFLKPNLEELLHKKFSRNQQVRLDGTNVIVFINERSQCDLTSRFENTDINWQAVEKQLLLWAICFKQGRGSHFIFLSTI